MENMDKGLGVYSSTKMCADKLAKNTPNAIKILGPICLLKPKRFSKEKVSLGVCSPCILY